jgi:hypothetical protein
MTVLIKTLISGAAIAFVLAVVVSLLGWTPLPASPESWSRASANLALLAIAIAVGLNGQPKAA